MPKPHANASGRDRLIDAVLDFLGGQDLLEANDIRLMLAREIDDAGPDALLALKARLAEDGGWEYYPRDPIAQRVHHSLARRFLAGDSELHGAEHLALVADGPVAMFANHLSYADANVIEVLLQRSGGTAFANRLTAIAGPKVFSSRARRFSSLCFGTIKVPQSAEVSSGEAALNAREVARAARRAIDVARERLRMGDVLLLFGEGTRSRRASMRPLLPGVARYLDVPGTWVVPVGLTGSETLFSIDDPLLRPARVVMAVGRPIRAEDLLAHANGDRRLVTDAIGLAIAELLPPSYRGAYGNVEDFSDAVAVLHGLRERRSD
jgi:1-acyl-sn-glycerol-3-phosphate acyltransferase